MNYTTTPVLIDTSVWIHFFKTKEEDIICTIVDTLINDNRAAMCGIIEAELLHGLRESEQKKIMPLLAALLFFETNRAIYQKVGKTLRELREKGITVPTTDSIIASTAQYYMIPVLTIDSHFDHFQVKRFPIVDN